MKNYFSLVIIIATVVFSTQFNVRATQKAKTDKNDSLRHLSPTYSNISYGQYNRNVIDLWIAEGDSPRPLLIYIHGGGWSGGDKDQIFSRVPISKWLGKGVSVASINYRYTSDAILPAPVFDAARAVQFLRFNAKKFNINTSRIALQGGSAGGCTALWILFHNDLADLSSTDPVLRESTRVQGAVGQFPQTSIDPVLLDAWIGEKATAYPMIFKAVGAASYADLMNNYAEYKPLIDEFSPINHIDSGDPPLYLIYPGNKYLPPSSPAEAIHHPLFGVKLKEKADKIGYKMDLDFSGTSNSRVEIFLEKILLENDSSGVLKNKSGSKAKAKYRRNKLKIHKK